MRPAKQIEYVPDPNKFDLVTHKFDPQGRLTSKNTYRTYIMDGSSYFERPVNSGNLWYENNQPAGRVELTFGPTGKIASKKFDFQAAHRDYVQPLTGAEAVHFELLAEREKNEAIAAELAAIKHDLAELRAVREGIPAATSAGSAIMPGSAPAAKQSPKLPNQRG